MVRVCHMEPARKCEKMTRLQSRPEAATGGTGWTLMEAPCI